jgi:toxin FitB
MIILDTNVISEIMNVSPHPGVLSWMRSIPTDQLATTAVCIAEIEFGLSRLPIGRKQRRLKAIFESFVENGFAGRVFPLDHDAASTFGGLAAKRLAIGRPFDPFDALIAAVAHNRKCVVATRNVSDFEEFGIEILNPWLVAA